MNIAVMTFRLRAPWVRSLKEKRMIVRSLVTQLQNQFHVSAAETGEQDTHTLIEIGIAASWNRFPVSQKSTAKRKSWRKPGRSAERKHHDQTGTDGIHLR